MLTSELRYELAELRTFGLYSQVDRYSFKITSFGNESYRENFFELGMGFRIGKRYALGMSVAGMNTWIKDMRNTFTYGIKIGGRFESDPLQISSWINNVNVPRVSSIDYVPLSYAVRFDYMVAPVLGLIFAVRGVETGLPFYNVGLAYAPYEILGLYVGVSSEPMLLEYGLRLSLGNMKLCYSGNRHQQLGLTHNLCLGFAR